MVKLNTKPREGYKNRHIDGLPDKPCLIEIITTCIGEEHFDICNWEPYDPAKYANGEQPNEGYLGTARTAQKNSIGFHAWKTHNSEFVYYRAV